MVEAAINKQMRIVLILIYLSTILSAKAQHTLSGRIFNHSGTIHIGYASIDVLGNRWVGTYADSLGNFQLHLPSDWQKNILTIKVSCTGYRDTTLTIERSKTATNMIVRLREFYEELPQVNVSLNFFTQKNIAGLSRLTKNAKIIEELKGSGAKQGQRSGIGMLITGVQTRVILDSVTLHIPENVPLPETLIFEVYEPKKIPVEGLVQVGFPLGRPLHKKIIYFSPKVAGWHTISLKPYSLISSQKPQALIIVVYARYTTPELQHSAGNTYISWAKTKDVHNFKNIWISNTEAEVVLLTNKFLSNSIIKKNEVLAMGLYYRSFQNTSEKSDTK